MFNQFNIYIFLSYLCVLLLIEFITLNATIETIFAYGQSGLYYILRIRLRITAQTAHTHTLMHISGYIQTYFNINYCQL